ncbi:A24 family peptidase [Thermotoga sp. SG1]|uniref:prepilin peptidase n=1 Tax=Thermotoga sp. SG1 TaxID=126739 RepID=UPI000C78C5A8|nr:A24 family peptidase [Thermotoga sp. SG1]PLV55544.1 peptidase A24 [Thermotoga sp. SG1]
MRHILMFGLGLIIGSFLNVVIYRSTKEGLKLWDPPYSFCPNCKSRIRWYDNVPLLSYVLLKGKCRYCGWKIPLRYPTVEFLTGLVFLLNSLFMKNVLDLLLSCVISSALIAISFIDLETFLIPDYLNFTVVAASFMMALRGYFLDHLLAFSVVTTIFLVLKFLYKEGLGMGDVILAMGIGILLPPFPAIVAVLTASVTGILFALIKEKGKMDIKMRIPFGPFLALGGYTLFLISYKMGWL